MSVAWFRFYGRLNDFLRRDQKEREIEVAFQGRQSLKHLVESLGVPHPEIGPIRSNGQDEALTSIAWDGQHVAVYPIEDGCLIEPRFLLDCHLGRLAAHLRMLGFDCLYQNDFDDSYMADLVQREGRILLTRDRRLLMRNAVVHGYCLRSLNPSTQVTEVVQRFDLAARAQPFHRCLRCNHLLDTVSKEAILNRLEPLTKKYFDDFRLCPACGQIYWKGSHYEQMQMTIAQVINARNARHQLDI